LIAARKAILERDRILDTMAALDVELAEKQTELAVLGVRRQHEWLDVAELESIGVATLVFSALGRHEQLLAQQVQEYLEAKLAYEQCQQRIASLQNNLHRLEEQLAELADCDELYEERRKRQKELLLHLDTAEAQQLHIITEALAQNEALLQEVEEAREHGRTAQTALATVQNHLRTLQASAIRYYELLDTLFSKSLQAQAALESFARELQDISEPFWHNHDPQQLELADTPFSFLALAAQLLAANSNEERLKLWLAHMDGLRRHVDGLLEIVDGRATHLQSTLTHLHDEQIALIDSMWQPHKFPAE
ncbi:MAG: hypothetical protein HC804_11315, partial [Anaerolineae bacterium]|nr:hypothetical protein [Anaerolineae bacterium]